MSRRFKEYTLQKDYNQMAVALKEKIETEFWSEKESIKLFSTNWK